MAEFTVEVKGLDALLKKFGKPFKPYIQALTMGIGADIQKHMQKAPGPVAHPIEWESEAQRRWYFAMRREKGFEGPYVRGAVNQGSQKMEQSWVTAKRGSMDAIVGTRATYAGYVQSDEKQQKMHRNTGWITDKVALARVKASGIIDRLWKDTVANFFSDRGGR
jgi:hypothetical protein